MNKDIEIRFLVVALIAQLAKESQKVMDLSMREITSRQWIPLIMIERFEYEPTLKEISEKCGIAHQSAKQLLNKLVEKEYVKEKRDEIDRRCLRYSLTEAGKAWGEENLYRNQIFLQELFEGISEDDLKLCLSIGEKLLEKLNMFKSNPAYWENKLVKDTPPTSER